MALAKQILILLISIILTALLNTGCSTAKLRRLSAPCKSMVVYYHEILYNGSNRKNATSAIVGEPAWGNKTVQAGPSRFGDVIAMDGPLTKDRDLHSRPMGRAHGFYVYSNREELGAWHGFSLLFNSTEHKGIINIAGYNAAMNETRQLSAMGGSGDFIMHKGIVTVKTDAFEEEVYYRLEMDVKLYECWSQ